MPRLDDAGGHVGMGVPVLLYLEKSSETCLIDVSVCRYRQFYEPSACDLRKVSHCMQGLWCQEAQY